MFSNQDFVCLENSSVSINPISNGGGHCTGCCKGMQCDSQLSVLLRNKTAKLHFHINRRLLRECASKIILNFPLKVGASLPGSFSCPGIGSAPHDAARTDKLNIFLGSSSNQIKNFCILCGVLKSQKLFLKLIDMN